MPMMTAAVGEEVVAATAAEVVANVAGDWNIPSITDEDESMLGCGGV